jgi:hypothetical protein
MDRKEVKQIADTEAKKEVKGHEKRMHPSGKKFSAGGKAGVTSESMKAMGRNLAKVGYQHKSGRGG